MSENTAAQAADQTTEDEPRAEAPAEAPTIADEVAGPASEALALRVEALLMTSDRPMPVARLSELLEKVGAKAVHDAVAALNRFYDASRRSFRIEQVAGGYQILTRPEYRQVLAALHRSRAQSRLGPAAIETLAIIAYKQPILRAEIENIRGVACGEVLRSLMDKRLIKIVGRAEELGRPMLYGTTKTFLETFGLSNLNDLPKVEELAGGKNA